MGDVEEWFYGADGRDAGEQSFLDALRAVAATSSWGISPEETSCMTSGAPLYLSVDLPAMTTFPGNRAARQLELTLWPTDSHQGLRLDGDWGNDDTPLDDVWFIEGGRLQVVGVQARADDLAQWAVRWIERQLARRIRFRQWRMGGGGATMEDTGEAVGLKAGPWARIGTPIFDTVVPAGQSYDLFAFRRRTDQ